VAGALRHIGLPQADMPFLVTKSRRHLPASHCPHRPGFAFRILKSKVEEIMNDGHREAVRGGHSDAQGDPDSEPVTAAAGAEPGTRSRVRQSTEVIIGWRVWRLNYKGEYPGKSGVRPLTLQSTYMDTTWPPGQQAKACCDVKRLHHGIHAFATQQQAIGYLSSGNKPRQYVYGQVSLWGRVVIHEDGYRAECAYPKHIYVPNRYRGGWDIVNALRRSYGVEVQWTT
jgi:hypothetical protein